MTEREFNARSETLLRNFAKAIREREESEVRAEFRATHRLIYVRRHTVEAYFRRARPRNHRRIDR